ncbi:MAG: SDR family oxidoreductase [Acidobacteriaceae bacterium]|nr:SDR family oxidoreductase [Acidobacteriaceae bacterium]
MAIEPGLTMRILVTGATGYVGGQLVSKLVEAGHDVICMVRDRSRVAQKRFQGAGIVEADALVPSSLPTVLDGIEVAYYLIHSMSGKDGFAERDQQASKNFAIAAKAAGVGRIVYLGGLASETAQVSPHLKSRHDTGSVLREYGPPLTEFRAGIIVGSGSMSFEMIRYLAERLPVMICPRWVITRTQPIAISDVLRYLVAALDVPESAGEIVEIGGSSIETYRSMMLTYAQQRGLRRFLLRVPVLTPRLSSYWLNLVTPIPAAIARPLIEGLRTEVVCSRDSAKRLFPAISPVPYAAAIQVALQRSIPDESRQVRPEADHVCVRRDGLITDVHQLTVNADREEVFHVLEDLGGDGGWLYADLLWQLRGWIDRLLGGVGMRRGRSRTGELNKDDRVDFWCVEEVSRPRNLVLRAEMKVPGRAWLQFRLSAEDRGRTHLGCWAWFEPRGLAGEIYWWVLYPIHYVIFKGLTTAIRRRAEAHRLMKDVYQHQPAVR